MQENLLITMAFLLGVAVGSLFEKLVQALFGTKESTPSASHNSGSPKCYCCGSENVVIECGSCKERRVFGTWSKQ